MFTLLDLLATLSPHVEVTHSPTHQLLRFILLRFTFLASPLPQPLLTSNNTAQLTGRHWTTFDTSRRRPSLGKINSACSQIVQKPNRVLTFLTS